MGEFDRKAEPGMLVKFSASLCTCLSYEKENQNPKTSESCPCLTAFEVSVRGEPCGRLAAYFLQFPIQSTPQDPSYQDSGPWDSRCAQSLATWPLALTWAPWGQVP